METTLLVLAAGIGSRFGGVKQIEPVGLHGEAIIDYSVYDALREGFGRVVFVIRRSIEADFRERIGKRFEDKLPVEYVFQELDALPEGYTPPPNREKPWGTGHAILLCRDLIDGPFAVINADDFYGRDAYATLNGFLRTVPGEAPRYSMVGYTLSHTMSEFGTVARGLCEVDEGGMLESVEEHTKIGYSGGNIVSSLDGGEDLVLSGEEIVSMNMFGFTPSIFASLERQFTEFLGKEGTSLKGEFYIPKAVNSLVEEGKATVEVLRTHAHWFGMTYREDLPRVRDKIRELISEGVYPEKLW